MKQDHYKVSVIIPTLNAGSVIDQLIVRLNKQTVYPDEIIIIDSESDDQTLIRAKSFKNVKCMTVRRKDFTHGRARNMAARQAQGDYLLFLTQDALPIDKYYIENLIKPFQDENVAMASGRQVAKKETTKREKLIREFNYPSESNKRTLKDLTKLGVKTYFFSDVCSAYRKDIFLKLEGFDESVKTSEDMLIAAKALASGYTIAYEASARVYHSHDFTFRQQYHRNYVIGEFFSENDDKLGNVEPESEGVKMVEYVIPRLLKEGAFIESLKFSRDCFIKLIGYRKGLHDGKRNMKRMNNHEESVCKG